MTLAELLELRATIVTQIAESGGITSVSVDGMSVNSDQSRQLATIDLEISKLQPAAAHRGLRFTQLVPPGGGG